MSESRFRRVPPTVDLPALDARVLSRWDETDAFLQSIEMRPKDKEYTFYDGPPFASGSPHYGHILAGVLKDIVPRYWTMRGYRVERRFGWDTHGLPVEMEVEKQLGISGPKQIHDFGVSQLQRGLPSDGRRHHRGVGGRHEAYGPLGRFRRRLQDHGHPLHGERVVGVPQALGQRPDLSRFQSDAIFLGGLDGPCRTSKSTSADTGTSTTRQSRYA